MILLPRTRSGWLALIVIVVLAGALGQLISPQWGAFSFALVAVIVGSLAIVTVEAWRADVWRGTSPPSRIDPSQSIDYLVWRFRHR